MQIGHDLQWWKPINSFPKGAVTLNVSFSTGSPEADDSMLAKWHDEPEHQQGHIENG